MGPECAPTQGPDDPSAPPDEDFTSRFTTAISRISRRIRGTSFTMTYGALSALATIDRSGPLRPAELADIERVTRPSITRIVAALESRGYISRTDDPDDGRAFVVAITSSGRTALKQARTERAGDIACLMEGLTDPQLEALHQALPALERIARNASTGTERR